MSVSVKFARRFLVPGFDSPGVFEKLIGEMPCLEEQRNYFSPKKMFSPSYALVSESLLMKCICRGFLLKLDLWPICEKHYNMNLIFSKYEMEGYTSYSYLN